MSAKAHFFSHDFNARNNYKFLELLDQYGWEGYGIFWALCEIIAENDKPIPLENIGGVARTLCLKKDFLEGFVGACVDINLLQNTDNHISSKGLESRLELKREKSRKAKENAKKRWSNAKGMQPQCDSNATAEQPQSSSNANNTTLHNTTLNNTKQNIKESGKPLAPKKSIKDRESEFKASLEEFADEYERSLLVEFAEYWTEPNQSGKKLKYELQKTWSTSRRLKKWASNNFSKPVVNAPKERPKTFQEIDAENFMKNMSAPNPFTAKREAMERAEAIKAGVLV